MPLELDHLLVPVRDRQSCAQLLAQILNVPWAESGIGPFSPVNISDFPTLDFDEAQAPYPVQHDCFRVDDLALPYRSTPHGAVDRRVNTEQGGRRAGA